MGLLDFLFGKRTAAPEAAKSNTPAGPEPVEYRLRWFEGDEGRGYFVERESDGMRLSWEYLHQSDGLKSFYVHGVSFREKALRSRAFDPGKPLALVPEENEHASTGIAIGVWDAERKLHIGYVPDEMVPKVLSILEEYPEAMCISMWEAIERRRRVGLRVLLAFSKDLTVKNLQ